MSKKTKVVYCIDMVLTGLVVLQILLCVISLLNGWSTTFSFFLNSVIVTTTISILFTAVTIYLIKKDEQTQ